MKILYCFPGWGRSGGARVIGEYCNRLAERGHDVRVYSEDHRRPNWFDLQARSITLNAARMAQWDVVVATNPTTVMPALSVHDTKRYAYFIQMWEHLFFKPHAQPYKLALQTYHRAIDAGMTLITIAEWLKGELTGLGAPLVYVVPNGVNREHFYPVGLDGDDYILVEGDSRNEAKDVDRIGWRVALELRKRYGIKLAGVATVSNEMTSKLDDFVLQPTLADYRRLYTNAKFMIKASRYEGRSLAPLEAMACGTPTCRAIIHGDDDLIADVNCVRVPYDYEALLSAAVTLMEDDLALSNITAGARAYAEQNLHWDPIVTRVEEILRD